MFVTFTAPSLFVATSLLTFVHAHAALTMLPASPQQAFRAVLLPPEGTHEDASFQVMVER